MLRLYEQAERITISEYRTHKGATLQLIGAVLVGQPLMFNISNDAGWMEFRELELPQAQRRTM